jgi:hypothetical protein
MRRSNYRSSGGEGTDRVGQVVEAAAGRTVRWDVTLNGGVDAALDSHGAAAFGLVGHGVGQGLDGATTVHPVAVVVQQGMYLRKRQGTGPTEHGDAGAAQPATPERYRRMVQRRQSGGPVGNGLACPTVTENRHEPSALAFEFEHELTTTGGEIGQMAVDLIDVGEQAMTLVDDVLSLVPVDRTALTELVVTPRRHVVTPDGER